jgi:hypothetical protein
MNARAYFSLMDAIAAARSADVLETMHARVSSTDMHPFERLALERQRRRAHDRAAGFVIALGSTRRAQRRIVCAGANTQLAGRSPSTLGTRAMERQRYDRPEMSSPEASRDARVREVDADVRARLRAVCANLPDEEFAALTRQIAEVAVKYEELTGLGAPRLVEPLPRLADGARSGAPPSA